MFLVVMSQAYHGQQPYHGHPSSELSRFLFEIGLLHAIIRQYCIETRGAITVYLLCKAPVCCALVSCSRSITVTRHCSSYAEYSQSPPPANALAGHSLCTCNSLGAARLYARKALGSQHPRCAVYCQSPPRDTFAMISLNGAK